MKTHLLIAAFLILSFSGFAQYNSENLELTTNEYSVERYTFENLRIYPIRANDVFRDFHKSVGTFNNLQSAILADDVDVTESSASGTVNTLFAENKSRYPSEQA